MAEYIPHYPECKLCGPQITNNTPKESILALILLLSHDIEKDRDRQGFWIEYKEDDGETCPVCQTPVANEMVIETSCLHRFHYDCIMHHVLAHDLKFCPDCGLRIF